VSGSATLEFGAASTVNTSFATGASGTVLLDDSIHFGASVSGFTSGDKIDTLDILFSASTTLNYTADAAGTGGTLAVSDGQHTANITLVGQYDPAAFQQAADQKGGTVITYDPTHHVA
jgi:hypothetical protein